MAAAHFLPLLFLLFTLLVAPTMGAAKKVKQQQQTQTKKTPAECATLGFNSESLTCATCSAILRVVGDEDLQQECLSCCTAGAEDEKYAHAVLELDKRFVAAFPDVGLILHSILAKKEGKSGKKESKAGKDRLVEIPMQVAHRYSFGARPTLHLYRSMEDTAPADSISVSTWSVDVFTDFFASHAL